MLLNYLDIKSPKILNYYKNYQFVKNKSESGLHFLESDICFIELIDKIYFKFSQYDTFHQNKENLAWMNKV